MERKILCARAGLVPALVVHPGIQWTYKKIKGCFRPKLGV